MAPTMIDATRWLRTLGLDRDAPLDGPGEIGVGALGQRMRHTP